MRIRPPVPSKPPPQDAAEEDRSVAPEGVSNREIAAWLGRQGSRGTETRSRDARRALSRSIVRYDDLTLFALSTAFLLLLWISPDARRDVFFASILQRNFFVMLALLGMVLSFVNVFFRHEKGDTEKWIMLLFAVLATAGIGVYAGYVVLSEVRNWLIIFPAWNILNSVILLSLFHEGAVTGDSITEGRATAGQVVLALISVGLVLGLCHYIFQLHWAIAYSICVGYTMSFHQALRDVFGPRPCDE
jgi:hypothetical protein